MLTGSRADSFPVHWLRSAEPPAVYCWPLPLPEGGGAALGHGLCHDHLQHQPLRCHPPPSTGCCFLVSVAGFWLCVTLDLLSVVTSSRKPSWRFKCILSCFICAQDTGTCYMGVKSSLNVIIIIIIIIIIYGKPCFYLCCVRESLTALVISTPTATGSSTVGTLVLFFSFLFFIVFCLPFTPWAETLGMLSLTQTLIHRHTQTIPLDLCVEKGWLSTLSHTLHFNSVVRSPVNNFQNLDPIPVLIIC